MIFYFMNGRNSTINEKYGTVLSSAFLHVLLYTYIIVKLMIVEVLPQVETTRSIRPITFIRMYFKYSVGNPFFFVLIRDRVAPNNAGLFYILARQILSLS